VESRVLLVEAEAPLRRSLEKYLKRAGYTFESCPSAREALLLITQFDPDVVIVEYHLPDANGADLIDNFLRISPDIRTILISEYDFQSIADALVRVNVDSFLKKPFDVAELETALSLGARPRRTPARSEKSGCQVCLPPFLNRVLSDT